MLVTALHLTAVWRYAGDVGKESFVSLKNVCSRQTVGCFKTAQRQAAIRYAQQFWTRPGGQVQI